MLHDLVPQLHEIVHLPVDDDRSGQEVEVRSRSAYPHILLVVVEQLMGLEFLPLACPIELVDAQLGPIELTHHLGSLEVVLVALEVEVLLETVGGLVNRGVVVVFLQAGAHELPLLLVGVIRDVRVLIHGCYNQYSIRLNRAI